MSKKKTKKTIKPSLWSDVRTKRIAGLSLVLIAIYLSIAFVSYFFTWKIDQDNLLHHSWSALFESKLALTNWMGRLGALLSHSFFYWGFGIMSFGFIAICIRAARDIIKQNSLGQFATFFMHTFLVIAFGAVVLEFIMHQSEFPWGGLFGYSVFTWMTHFLGTIGLLFLMIFLMIGATIWFINPSLVSEDFSLGKFENISISLPSFLKFQTEGVQSYFDRMDSEVEDKPTKSKKSKRRKHDDKGDFDIVDDSGELDTDGGTLDFDIPVKEKKSKKKAVPRPEPSFEMDIIEPEPPLVPVKPALEEVVVPPTNVETNLLVTQEDQNAVQLEPYDPKLELSNYVYPTIDMLNDYQDPSARIDRDELEANKDQIIETLSHYKIEIVKIRATIGPTVTLYEIIPTPGTKIKSIKNLEDDIALSLSALGIRIIAPIPGKGTIGIEVPNKNKQTVGLKELITTDKFKQTKMKLPIALGKTISNEIFIADLAKMPHLLIAGATGQGKSVGINTILMSLLYKKHPSQVKIVMIDPKKVELFPYASLEKHFLSFLPNADEPIITDTDKAIHTLTSLTIEMDARYDLLKKARSRNIEEYNKKFIDRKLNPLDGHRYLPFIVLVIDEFADLIMTAGKEVELPIARLAQLARAIGIHLIIATQRPTTNIITGVIKANFPARIAFKVTSNIDSRTILDSKGAEQLIGRGDMLFTIGSDIVRLQCAFVDTPEVEKVIDFISEQQGFSQPYYLPEAESEDGIGGDSNLKWSDLDEYFEEAGRMVVMNQNGSTSMLQRKFQLGYNRAGRIMDQLESLGIVGGPNGSKPRDVLFMSEMELMNYFDHLKKK